MLLPEHFERDCVECINTLNFIWCFHSVNMNSGSSGRNRKSYYPCAEHTQIAQYPGQGVKHKTKIVMQVLSSLLANCSIFLFIFFFQKQSRRASNVGESPPPWQKSKRREALPPPSRSGCCLLNQALEREQVHQSRLSVTDSFTEVFSWHKVYIWTFKSRCANRCLLSNSITKPDLTWVRKILFPSFFIFHLEIAFHCRRQPRVLWLERNVGRWKWRVLSVRGERMHFRWALLPGWGLRMLMKPAIIFQQVLVSRPLSPQILTHCEFAVFHSDSVCMCLASGQILFSRIEGIVYVLVDFSFEWRWDQMNDIVLGFFQIHVSSCTYY